MPVGFWADLHRAVADAVPGSWKRRISKAPHGRTTSTATPSTRFAPESLPEPVWPYGCLSPPTSTPSWEPSPQRASSPTARSRSRSRPRRRGCPPGPSTADSTTSTTRPRWATCAGYDWNALWQRFSDSWPLSASEQAVAGGRRGDLSRRPPADLSQHALHPPGSCRRASARGQATELAPGGRDSAKVYPPMSGPPPTSYKRWRTARIRACPIRRRGTFRRCGRGVQRTAYPGRGPGPDLVTAALVVQ